MVVCVAAIVAVYVSGSFNAVIYRYEYLMFQDYERIRGRSKIRRYDDLLVTIETYYLDSGFLCSQLKNGRTFSWDKNGRSHPKVYPWHAPAEDQKRGEAPAWVYSDRLFKDSSLYVSPYIQRYDPRVILRLKGPPERVSVRGR